MKNNLNRIAVICEDISPPLDEGFKKATTLLIEAIGAQITSLLLAKRGSSTVHCVNTVQLPANRLLIGKRFLSSVHAFSPDAVLYFPASSVTSASLFRSMLLKITAGGTLTAIVGFQPRHLWPIFHLFRFLRNNLIIFAQSSLSVDYYNSFGIKSRWLPSGVDLQTFIPVCCQTKVRLRKEYGFSEKDKIILHVGHVKWERNVSLLCELAHEFKVVIIGSTSTRQEKSLLSYVKSKGIILITEYIERIEHFYQLCDCYVFPVTSSSAAIESPLSILEAMACNIPVVSSSFGEIPYMFQEGSGFKIFKSKNELYSKIRMATSEECKNREKVKKYSWQAISKQLVTVIENQLGEKYRKSFF